MSHMLVWLSMVYVSGAAAACCILGVRYQRMVESGKWEKYRDGYPGDVLAGYSVCALLWPIAWLLFVPDAIGAFGQWWCRKPSKVDPPYKAPVDPKSYREAP